MTINNSYYFEFIMGTLTIYLLIVSHPDTQRRRKFAMLGWHKTEMIRTITVIVYIYTYGEMFQKVLWNFLACGWFSNNSPKFYLIRRFSINAAMRFPLYLCSGFRPVVTALQRHTIHKWHLLLFGQRWQFNLESFNFTIYCVKSS